MQRSIYKNSDKKHIILLMTLISLVSFIFIPTYSYANAPDPSKFFQEDGRLFGYIEGNSCGTETCTPDQVCQKEYRGVLPIEDEEINTPSNTSFRCVSPRPIEAPDSPYKGDTGCSAGISGLDGILGDTVSGLLGQGVLGSLFGGVELNLLGGLFGGIFGGGGLKFTPPGGFVGSLLSSISDPLISRFRGLLGDGGSGFNGLINVDGDCAYNNIDTVIDSRRLTAPLPVDIFNPLPLPVNVTSPTPLPVVVIDDLALYQQKELIDAPLAALQKAQTIATVSDTLRYQVSIDNLAINNYFSTMKLGWQYGAIDNKTGVAGREAIDVYGDYQNFALDQNNATIQAFRDLQDQKSLLKPETFTEKCGNITPAEAVNAGWECSILILQSNNAPGDITENIRELAADKSRLATELLQMEVKDGYMATTLNNDKNPLTKQITSPSSAVQAATDKVFAATIDQAIIASGDNCFESIPNNIINGSLKPILTQGLFNITDPLYSRLTTGNSLQNPPNFSIFSEPTPTPSPGASPSASPTLTPPDVNQFFSSLANSLLKDVTSGLSCVFNRQIMGLLNGLIGNIIPGLGAGDIPGLGAAILEGASAGTGTDTDTGEIQINI